MVQGMHDLQNPKRLQSTTYETASARFYADAWRVICNRYIIWRAVSQR